jgi:hypothetical protein
VTNPPIDPLREAIVMSLEICLGAERNIFQESPEHASRVILSSPVISPAKWRSLMNLERGLRPPDHRPQLRRERRPGSGHPQRRRPGRRSRARRRPRWC